MTMVDRITPAATPHDRIQLRASYGVEDQCPVVAEDFMQWVGVCTLLSPC